MKNSQQQSSILIVEDIDWIRFGMKMIVERQRFQALEATNDAAAIARAELEPIELILTEEELPTFNILMTRLREHATLSSIPVVIVNPDAEAGARLNDAYLIPTYEDITSLLTDRQLKEPRL